MSNRILFLFWKCREPLDFVEWRLTWADYSLGISILLQSGGWTGVRRVLKQGDLPTSYFSSLGYEELHQGIGSVREGSIYERC